MAGKSTGWSTLGFVLLACVLACGQGGGVMGAANDGAVYLDLKEEYVKSIASGVGVNQANCGSLGRCSKACTRAVCYPIAGQKTADCFQVDNNEYCVANGGSSCKFMLLDYTQSYTTLPPPGDINKIQPEVARDICLQKSLEQTFQNISKPSRGDSEYSLVYYGSVSGAWVSLPGRESNCSMPYETRKRPWYLDGISVTKEVKILIDVGSSMAAQVSPDYGRPPEYTYLNLAQEITQEVLQTFTSQDYVEVITFDSLKQTSLGAAVNIKPYDSFDPAGRPELAPLVANVKGLVTSPGVDPSVLDSAVSLAASSFVSENTRSYLKVIIVLSNGQFAPLNSTAKGFSPQAVKDLQAKLMIYKLPMNQQDRFLTSTTLKQNLCSVNGSFEVLVPLETRNPLYSIRSYFTYLARVHLAVDDKPNWSNKYQSYSQLHNISTVTYPVFGADNLLLGVAAIDVAIEDLSPNLIPLILNDLPNRSQGILPAPATFPMTCDYQTADRTPTCPTSGVDGAVCKQTDFSSSVEQRTCCTGRVSDTCAVPKEPSDGGLRWAVWKIVVVIVGGLLGIVLAAIFVKKRCCGPRAEPTNYVYTGHDSVLDSHSGSRVGAVVDRPVENRPVDEVDVKNF